MRTNASGHHLINDVYVDDDDDDFGVDYGDYDDSNRLINGIYYHLYPNGKASVTNKNWWYIDDPSLDTYIGRVSIPSTIIYNGTEYYVTSISSSAFQGCSRLTSVIIPNGVTSIGDHAFQGCDGMTSITIPSSVTSISSSAFQGCSRLTSVTIPNGVTSIGDQAFQGCDGMSSITIPSSVTSIGSSAFSGCNSLKSVNITDLSAWCNVLLSNPFPEGYTLCLNGEKIEQLNIPDGVTSIGRNAFCGCSSLTSVNIPNSVTSVGGSAFYGCRDLKSINILNSVTTIASNAFDGTAWFNNQEDGLVYINNMAYKYKGTMPKNTNISIKNGTTYIGNGAFQGCSGLTSVNIPSSVTSIGALAFYGCSGLISVNIPYSVTYIDYQAFQGCSSLTSIDIPNSVTSIGSFAFQGCSRLSSITILGRCVKVGTQVFEGTAWYDNQADGLVYIGNVAYKYKGEMPDNTSISIKEGTTSIGDDAFVGCSGLNSISIPRSIEYIGNGAFETSGNLTTVHITDISAWCKKECGDWFFPGWYNYHLYLNGEEVTELIIPNDVTSIGSCAFLRCKSLTSVTIPESVTSIGWGAFDSDAKIYVKASTPALLALWRGGHTPYDMDSGKELTRPSLDIIATTQTTATGRINNWYDGYTYTCNDEIIKTKEFNFSKLKPGIEQAVKLIISKGDVQYEIKKNCTTQGLSPHIETWTSTASSISAKGAYMEGDAKVVASKIQIAESEPMANNEGSISGLTPNKGYIVDYTIEVDYGGTENAFYTCTDYAYTQPLQFSTAQPKVVSEGNVVVSASTNLDENEENVGFEWRCIDWTDEFPSNTGTAYLYDGAIEGNIKNLNTNKLWKFRPYYLSDSGTYHYGDWMGVDPTNTSYFEPTVRTYAKINIQGNTALVKGYALSGTDDVVVKGFKYWRTRNGVHKASTRSVNLPSDAITVEATGQQAISANLTGLDYNATYHYVAFVTTSAGETYYGEEQMFTTPLATAKYATFYDSQSAYTLPKGLTASVLTGVNNKQLTYKVIAEGGKSNNVVPKGVAVMLTSTKNDATSYTMTPTESEATYTGANLLKGSDVATTTTGSNCWHYKLSYGASDTDMSQTFGWYWGAANGGAFQIESHKAWLAVPKNAGAAARAFSVEGEATDIVEVEKDETQEGTDVYYDMQGRPVEKPVSKGVYIYQGRKIIIK